MFASTIPYYDRIYDLKDYAGEARQVEALIKRHARPGSRTLLDIACGTGRHLEHLGKRFQVEGSDLMPEMIDVARRRLPGVPLHVGDFRTLDLGRRFDVVTCLFSSIGYAATEADLHAAWRAFRRHLAPGGLALVEPWFRVEQVEPGKIALRVIDEPDLKLARMSTSRLEGRNFIADMHHLIGTHEDTRHVVERHVLACWSLAEMEAAIRAAGLTPEWLPEGLGRGAWLGTAP